MRKVFKTIRTLNYFRKQCSVDNFCNYVWNHVYKVYKSYNIKQYFIIFVRISLGLFFPLPIPESSKRVGSVAGPGTVGI